MELQDCARLFKQAAQRRLEHIQSVASNPQPLDPRLSVLDSPARRHAPWRKGLAGAVFAASGFVSLCFHARPHFWLQFLEWLGKTRVGLQLSYLSFPSSSSTQTHATSNLEARSVVKKLSNRNRSRGYVGTKLLHVSAREDTCRYICDSCHEIGS